MQEVDVGRVMVLVAVATVIVGLLILTMSNVVAGGEGPMAASIRRNALILTFSGPVSLGFWHLFNGLLRGMGYRSVVGYVLAVLVFVAGGFATGFFSRLRKK